MYVQNLKRNVLKIKKLSLRIVSLKVQKLFFSIISIFFFLFRKRLRIASLDDISRIAPPSTLPND